MKNNSSHQLVRILLLVVIFGAGFLFGLQQQSGPSSFVDSLRGNAFGVNSPENIDLSLLWQVWNHLDRRFVPANSETLPSNKDKVYGLIKGLTQSYSDPYTTFLTPDELVRFNEGVNGSFSGVGMEVEKKDGILQVVAPLKDTPADRAGIRAGDIIFKINDTLTQNLTTNEAVMLIRGPVGTVVELTIMRAGLTDPLVLDLTRAEIKVPSLETEIIDDVFVISLYSFNTDIGERFREAVNEYENSAVTGLVLDLRDNPGGYLNGAVEVAGWFTEAGQVIVRERSSSEEDQGRDRLYRSQNSYVGKLQNQPVIVLVNGGSASASEIVAGALKDHELAAVIGEATFGKGSVQELIGLSSNSALKVTTARWLTPKGISISEQGLIPETIIEDDIATDADEQLEMAIDLIKSL